MEIFQKEYNWYKGNLHAHTTRSDGRKTPEEVCALYAAEGYDFLALTDHRIYHAGDEAATPLLLSGIELDCSGDREVCHIVGVGMEREIPEVRDICRSPQTMIYSICDASGLAILAHPVWSLMRTDTVLGLRGLTAAEVFNSVSRAPWNGDRADSGVFLDTVAAQGRPVSLVATDDSHWYNGEQFGGWIMVNAPTLSRASIMEAISAGRYYSTQGPKIDSISFMGNELVIRAREAESVLFYSNLQWVSDRFRAKDASGTYRYVLHPGETFVRAEIFNAAGKRAFTNMFLQS